MERSEDGNIILTTGCPVTALVGDTLTEQERQNLENKFKDQEGQQYPCSNQVVVCGFFSDAQTWDAFVNSFDVDMTIARTESSIYLTSGERWHHFTPSSYSCRGYRFYKLYVDKNINRNIFFEVIYPYTSFYCKELKFI